MLCVTTFCEFAELPRADLTPETIQTAHRETWLEFRSHPLYTGSTWFMPAVLRYQDWADRLGL